MRAKEEGIVVRINLWCEREPGKQPYRIRDKLRDRALGKELVLYASIFCAMTTVACAWWLVQAYT